ncbi:MAG TPA: hypothetical protein VFK06_17010 [Candidatus Angelobacter sp.]|nr:hypothetical protein [Candidatus Angelobacter sp.]
MNRLTLFLCLCVFVLPATAYESTTKYDGHWWKALSADEQVAFVSGYYDCFIYDARGTEYSDDSLIQETKKVSEYYKSHSGSEDDLIIQVLHRLSTGKRHSGWKAEKHGENDGDYWRQSSHSERDAFVRGYIVCQTTHLHARFSRPIKTYVSAISKWYGVNDEDVSELSSKTGNDKIGDVLVRLRDGSTMNH